MVYVDIRKNASIIGDRITLDDKDIEVSNVKVIGCEDLGDEDCIKMVTTVSAIDVKIEADAVAKFPRLDNIFMIRFNYYQPAYELKCTMKSCEKLSDGSLLLKYA